MFTKQSFLTHCGCQCWWPSSCFLSSQFFLQCAGPITPRKAEGAHCPAMLEYGPLALNSGQCTEKRCQSSLVWPKKLRDGTVQDCQAANARFSGTHCVRVGIFVPIEYWLDLQSGILRRSICLTFCSSFFDSLWLAVLVAMFLLPL